MNFNIMGAFLYGNGVDTVIQKETIKKYDTVIVGAGAAGLYCGCKLDLPNAVILEKGKRPGVKLLMAGNGQCNVTHGGSVKDFLGCYGSKGKHIRGALQRHNNVELCKFFERLGVPLHEREDGKIFPESMDGKDVLTSLLRGIDRKNIDIRFGVDIEKISERSGDSKRGFELVSEAGSFACRNLIIATGGCSYPASGSDGAMLGVLERDLGLSVVEPSPALTPVFVKDYRYGDLRGMSFKDVEVKILSITGDEHRLFGDLLFTERNLSGPVILNGSRYMKAGDTLQINYVYPLTESALIARLKKDFPSNDKSPQSYISVELGLPKRFAQTIAKELKIEGSKVSQLSGAGIKALAATLTKSTFIIRKLGNFNTAMATAGGVNLEEIDLRTMQSKKYKGLYVIGEALDIDGDTGGYNLQFAYSSAAAAADSINRD